MTMKTITKNKKENGVLNNHNGVEVKSDESDEAFPSHQNDRFSPENEVLTSNLNDQEKKKTEENSDYEEEEDSQTSSSSSSNEPYEDDFDKVSKEWKASLPSTALKREDVAERDRRLDVDWDDDGKLYESTQQSGVVGIQAKKKENDISMFEKLKMSRKSRQKRE